MLRVTFLVAAVGLGTAACFGQAFTANLTGLVLDPNQASIPGATVKIRNLTTGENRQTVTGPEGRYTFSQLLPGAYEVTAEAKGFKTAVQRDITLLANQSAEINIAMQLGEVSQTVEVTEDVMKVDSQTANQSVTLDQNAVVDLPVNARNPFVLVHATAGVVAVRTGISTATQDQNHNRFAMNGGRDESGLILLDGVPVTTGDWSALIIAPSVDSVQEVQVIRNSYEAQFGKSGGGVVSMVTKSGSNEIHGEAFEFLRNNVLDANLWENNRHGRPRTQFQRNQFGGNFSAPLWKSKKVYIFGGYDGLRQGSPSTTTVTVPTALQRQGDFSQTFNPDGSLSVIYNPFTTRPNPNGPGFVRDPFSGNRIPPNMFDPIGARMTSLFPQPNAAGDAITNARNYFAAGKTVAVNDRFDIRVDWAHNEKHQFYARVSKAWEKDIAPILLGYFMDSNFSDQNPRHQVAIGNTFIPSPTLVINLLIGSGRWREEQDSPSKGLDATRIGYSRAFAGMLSAQTIPQFNLDGYATLGNARFLNFPRETHNLQVNVTKERAAHSIKFGFTVESAKLNDVDIRSADFSFNRGMTSGPAAAANSSVSGNSVASLLLGTGSSGSAPLTVRPASNQMYCAWYAQDSWKIGRRLTVNYGLRYEIQKPRTERFNRFNWFDFTAANPLSAQVGIPLRGGLVFASQNNRYLWDTDYHDFAPRIGISTRITEKLVARTGYGIYYLQTVGGGPTSGTDGFSTSTAWVSSRGGDGINPQDLVSNPFPQGLVQPAGSSLGMLTQVGQSVTAWQRRHPSGYVQNYSFDLQYQISRSTLVELGYAGSQSRKLLYGYGLNADQLPDNLLSLGAALDTPVANPFFGVITSGTLAGPTLPLQRLLRPYPQFTAVNIPGDTPGAGASFNALVAKITHRFQGGLNLFSSFQWAKAIDNASETQAWEISDNYRDVNNLRIERSISGHDIPYSWASALVYELPVGKGKRFGGGMGPVANAVAGGWQVSAISRIAAGLPLQVTAPSTLSQYGFGVQRPVIADLKNLELLNQSPDLWFNTKAFSAPAPFMIGNTPRWLSNLRFGPARSADIAVMKNFHWRERFKAQLRGEFFNAFNTPQFGRAETNLASPSFGTVSGTTNVGPRNVQLGLKLSF